MKPDAELLTKIIAALGRQQEVEEDWSPFAEALFAHHRSALRLRHEVMPADLPMALDRVPWYPLGFRASDSDVRSSQTLNYAAGDYFLQDAGSMLALAACEADDPPQGRIVCDLCAAPGGKASALLESIGSGFLLANEPIRSRLPPLNYNLSRTGSDRFAISCLDPETLAERLAGTFDLVLADVPCSGQALMGRGKQTVAALSMQQIEHSAKRARRILSAATQLLKPGGQLVLSTCTFAEAENEQQVEWMLSEGDMEIDPVDSLSEYANAETSSCYRLWPHLHQCAGSFSARLICRSDMRQPGARKRSKGKREKPPRLPVDLETWFEDVPDFRYRVDDASLLGWPADTPPWVESVAVAGPELAYRTGRTWKPSHASALRCGRSLTARNHADVPDQQALRFVRGEPIDCDSRGWTMVRWSDRPLGWVKASGGVGKNHLPTAARLK